MATVRLTLLAGAVLVTAALPARAGTDEADRLPVYLAAVSARLPDLVLLALSRIAGDDRKLLATRAYLRVGTGIAERWSWTDEQIARYQLSDEYRAALSEIDKIKARFAELNPGYTLYVNTDVRSLDAQIARWNENASVGAAAAALSRDATRVLAAYPARPGGAAVKRFIGWLEDWRPPSAPTLAAPGLSPHGRSRAFDFQIQQDATLVAGTDSTIIATVWDSGGWTQKLAAAVAISPHFRGPLSSPREPWHYEYVP
jgi:hypothetical protein